MQANHNKPNNTQNQPDDPQIPQPDLRFVKRNNKPDKQKGPEPKQKHPPKRFAKGHSGLTTASFSKTCENELKPRHSKRQEGLNSLPVNFGIDVPKLYMSTGLQLMPLSASSRISLSRRPPGKESLSYLLREQECRGGHCARYPPVGGADGSGAQDASQASEKLPNSHRRSSSAGPLIS